MAEDLHDRDFLDRCCNGFERFRAYLMGERDGLPKDAAWAARISGLSAEWIRGLARRIAARRTVIGISWSLNRADHGEQPYWALVALAAVLGQIGLPGGGFGVGYGCENGPGSRHARWPAARVPAGANPVRAFIPVARIADMLLILLVKTPLCQGLARTAFGHLRSGSYHHRYC